MERPEGEMGGPNGASTTPAFRWLSVGGVRIRCWVAGASGASVVLLHGGGADAADFSFREAVLPLAAGHRVFVPEWPGFGESGPMPPGWTTPDLVRHLARALDALGVQRASLVGLSLGGGVALGFALAFPDRVEKLVLVDSYGLGESMTETFGRGGAVAGWLLVRTPGLNAVLWRMLRLAARNERLAWWLTRAALPHRRIGPEDRALVAALRQLLLRPSAGAGWRQLQAAEVRWGRMATSYVDRLAELTAPTLIVHGQGDPVVPLAWAERAGRLIPHARVAVVPNAGHVVPLEQPAAFNRLVAAFLDEEDAPLPG